MNEWYLEDMSDNIRSVLDSRRENGFHIGAFVLYGYQKDPKQKGRLYDGRRGWLLWCGEVLRAVFNKDTVRQI